MASQEQTMVFRKGFLIDLGLEPTQDGAGPKMGTAGEGEEVGEISMMVLAGVLGADMSFLRAMVGVTAKMATRLVSL